MKTILNQPIRRYGSHLLLCFNYVTQRLKPSYGSYTATDQCLRLEFHVTIFGDHDKAQCLGTRSDTMENTAKNRACKMGSCPQRALLVLRLQASASAWMHRFSV